MASTTGTMTVELDVRQKEFDILLISGLNAGVIIPEGSAFEGQVQFLFFAGAHMLCVRAGKQGIRGLLNVIAVADSAFDGSLLSEILNLRVEKSCADAIDQGDQDEKLFWQSADLFSAGTTTVKLNDWVTVEEIDIPVDVFDPDQTIPP